MPCRSDYMKDTPLEKLTKEQAECKHSLDTITTMACLACKTLEHNKLPEMNWPKRLLNWWNMHKKIDAKRIKAEQEKAIREAKALRLKADRILSEAGLQLDDA